MYYYQHNGASLASTAPLDGFTPAPPPADGQLFVAIHGDPVLGRSLFRVNHPGQLTDPHSLNVLDASRLPQTELDAPLTAALERGQLTAVNIDRPGWQACLVSPPPARNE